MFGFSRKFTVVAAIGVLEAVTDFCWHAPSLLVGLIWCLNLTLIALIGFNAGRMKEITGRIKRLQELKEMPDTINLRQAASDGAFLIPPVKVVRDPGKQEGFMACYDLERAPWAKHLPNLSLAIGTGDSVEAAFTNLLACTSIVTVHVHERNNEQHG